MSRNFSIASDTYVALHAATVDIKGTQKFRVLLTNVKPSLDCLLLLTLIWRPNSGGPEKNTPTFPGEACRLQMDSNTVSQLGRPIIGGVRSPVMALCFVYASLLETSEAA